MMKKRTESTRPEGAGSNQTRLSLGMFTVYPAFGSIQAGNLQTVTVDSIAEIQGQSEEEISIDIIGRNPKDSPSGISYRLLAEACIPSINLEDIGSIFEEHRICKNVNVAIGEQQLDCGGVYGEEEKRFAFTSVLVGLKVKARFKISNTRKVPCDVIFSVKTSSSSKGAKSDIFDVTPSRVQISAHGHVYAVVTFSPIAMQQYTAIFEAAIETLIQSQSKGRSLIFELSGEGSLPHANVIKPSVRNKKGQPLLLFKKNLIGRIQTLPLIILNDGNLTCKVDIQLIDPDEVFAIRSLGGRPSSSDGTDWRGLKSAMTTAILEVNETASFEVSFQPDIARRSQGQIRLSVVNNQYEDSVIQLVGEGYLDSITVDIHHACQSTTDQEEGMMAGDDVQAAKCNFIKFGDCSINEPRTISFSMTNHRDTEVVRFVWPDHPHLRFSPQIGHLLSKSTKDMSVTFRTDRPFSLKTLELKCKVTKIILEQAMFDGLDWDDRLKTVKWVEVPRTSPPSSDGAPPTQLSSTASQPGKRKVVETEPEPAYKEVPEFSQAASVLVSATADYSKYKIDEENLHFRDTLMFQSRIYQLLLHNKGSISLDYNWKVVMDEFKHHTTSVLSPRGGSETPRPLTAGLFLVHPDEPRPSSSCTNRLDNIPFSIEPELGTVHPGKSAQFFLKFSPLDANNYEGRLICSIPNLEPNTHGPVIGLKARSLMPFCHFELKDSDYIRSARRNPELPGPSGAPAGTNLDPNTRVLEIDCIGIGTKFCKSFSIINPTNQNYTFVWINEDGLGMNRSTEINCTTQQGNIFSGKTSQITFEFTPSSLDLVESFWRFDIPEQSITIPFLLVGQSRDPSIVLDRSHINLKRVMIGHEATECFYIINNENQSFNYNFDETSCHSAGFTSKLQIEPMRGILSPKSRLTISLRFSAKMKKEVNFNVICNVKQKMFPLTLNVKAEGYQLNCLVLCEETAGTKNELLCVARNNVNFGQVEINESAVRNISIVNLGKFRFDYTWVLKEQLSLTSSVVNREPMILIQPITGMVEQGDKIECLVTFCPTRAASIRNCELVLQVAHGPTYNIDVSGKGVLPGIQFSILSHSFGTVFVYRAGMPTQSTVLKLTNRDTKDISVNCLYSSTAWLKHNFEACVISPKETVEVTFTFYPIEPVKYKETVEFEINGLSKQSVEFTCQGADMKIEVADPRQKTVKFGALRIGQTLRKIVPIVNNSAAAITFCLTLTPTCLALQSEGVLTVSPTELITLQPKGGMAKVEVVLSPKSRIANFTEEVHMEFAGLHQTLFLLTGSCQGIEISLDTNSIPFGAVVQKSASTRQIIITNSGDIGAKFKWDGSMLAPNFTMTPLEGYISAGMQVPIDIIFHPPDVGDFRCQNLKCTIEGMKPLQVTLTGTCINVPSMKEVYHFTTVVRQKETKNLQLSNHTNQIWNLRPIIEGEFWSGPDTIQIAPQATKIYELTYQPLTMTAEGKKHTGNIFFPLPDGTGLMYNVSGSADPPKPNGKVNREVPCKTMYMEMLLVHNWLKKPQRFRVKIESIRPDKLDPGTTIKGLDYIDVQGLSSKDYKLNFHAHKESQPQIKVTFTNEQSGEYQFYDVMIRAVRPGVISSIQITTPVRQRKQYILMLENPLTYAVTFTASCNVPEVQILSQISVPASSEGAYSFDYFPLKVATTQGKLEFNCSDLGLYTYDLELRATMSGPERALHFNTCLGNSQALMAKFINFSKHKTDYTCKVDNGDFHVDKLVPAAPASSSGTEVSFEVSYEPSSIGESHATLMLSSTTGSDYVFPLFGVCTTPKPQGPFVVKSGSTVSITFRNVFPQTTAFTFQVDNPLFHITKASENVKARKDHRIVIGFDGNDRVSKSAAMGRLTVSCMQSAGGMYNAQWVYYLKGVIPEGRDSKDNK